MFTHSHGIVNTLFPIYYVYGEENPQKWMREIFYIHCCLSHSSQFNNSTMYNMGRETMGNTFIKLGSWKIHQVLVTWLLYVVLVTWNCSGWWLVLSCTFPLIFIKMESCCCVIVWHYLNIRVSTLDHHEKKPWLSVTYVECNLEYTLDSSWSS